MVINSEQDERKPQFTNLNSYLIQRIKEHVKEPVPWLTQLLDIRKETAYRRLHGKIPFTVDEFSILAKELDIPVGGCCTSNFDSENITNLPLYILKQYLKYIEAVSKYPNVCNMQTARRIFFLPCWLEMPHLFQMFCYKYIHRVSKSGTDIKNSVNDELFEVRRQILEHRRTVRSENEVIIYKKLLDSLIDDVQYFYLCKLISRDEINAIKKELHELVNRLENIMQTGYDESGNHYIFYLSMVNVESDIICSCLDDNKIYSMQWQPENYSVCFLREGNTYKKRWINTMKRYSSVITLSNEILRSEYFEKQRKIIDAIGEESTGFY
jgi:hypothetical protein